MIPRGAIDRNHKSQIRRDDRRRPSRPCSTTRVSRWGGQNDNPPNGHQGTPTVRGPTDSLPDFDDVSKLPDGVLRAEAIKEEEIPASPITPEAQIAQIEADNELAQKIHADEQVGVDQAHARQLQEPHSITVPRPWLQNGQHFEPTDTPGARGSNCTQLPDPNHPAEHQQLLPGNNRIRRRNLTKLGHRHQLRLLLRAVIQFNFPLATGSQLLGTSLPKMTRRQRKDQLEQGHLINIVLDYALNSNYSVSLYCAYLVLSELQYNSNILNLRHAGKIDGEHPITGMLRYFALVKRARPQRNDGTIELPYHEFRYMEAILTKAAIDQRIEFPHYDQLELHSMAMVRLQPKRIDCHRRLGFQMPNPIPITATKKIEF